MSNNRSKKKNTGKTKEKRKFTFYIFPLISLVIACVCLWYIITWARENGINKEVMDAIYDETVEKNEETGETLINFAKLKEKNKDTVGWLRVNNTSVNYPIVQAEDNSFYIEHNFNGEPNLAGWVFADYRAKADGTDNNFVIYGHNMKDGSMFGTIKKALNKDWYENEENLDIIYETNEGRYTYRIFSIYETPTESYYTNMAFSSDEEYKNFLDTLKSRSRKDFGLDLNPTDNILTLSTCGANSNTRVVIHAVLSDVIAF